MAQFENSVVENSLVENSLVENSLVETDLHLLEEYLDGALESAAVARLQARLSTDQNLSDELKSMRSQRTLRQAALQSMEPDAASAERLVWRVRGAMHDQQQQKQIQPAALWSQWRIASIGSAAAACLILGFFAGRAGNMSVSPQNTVPTGIVSNATRTNLVSLPHDDQQPNGQFVAVSHTPQISVPITNEYGQVVAWQNFDNADQAKSFTEELHRAHGESVPATSGGTAKLVDHEEQVPF